MVITTLVLMSKCLDHKKVREIVPAASVKNNCSQVPLAVPGAGSTTVYYYLGPPEDAEDLVGLASTVTAAPCSLS